MAETTEVKTDERAMRYALYEFRYTFARRVELAATRIADSADDPEIARRALYWRLAAISEVQRAAFQQDVLVGLLDAWTLALQQQAYFTSGAGRSAFGAAQPIALETSADLVDGMVQMAKPFASDAAFQRGSKAVHEWAKEHPIQDASFARRSIAARFADRGAKASADHDPAQSLANMESSIEDLLHRVNVYADQLPRQAMGESEQLLDAFLEKRRLVHAFDMLEGMHGDMSTMTAVVGGLPETLRQERVAAFESVAAERGILVDAMTKERLALQEALEQERAIVVREAQQMVQQALATLVAERQAVMQELPGVTGQTLAVNQRQIERLIDRLVLGLALVVAVAGVLLLLLLIVAKRSGFLSFRPGGDELPEVPKVVAKT